MISFLYSFFNVSEEQQHILVRDSTLAPVKFTGAALATASHFEDYYDNVAKKIVSNKITSSVYVTKEDHLIVYCTGQKFVDSTIVQVIYALSCKRDVITEKDLIKELTKQLQFSSSSLQIYDYLNLDITVGVSDVPN